MFQALSLTWRMCLGGDLIAEIYRHSSEFLSVPEFQPQVQAVLDAVAQAGEEVVRQGQVSPATMAALTQDLAPPTPWRACPGNSGPKAAPGNLG